MFFLFLGGVFTSDVLEVQIQSCLLSLCDVKVAFFCLLFFVFFAIGGVFLCRMRSPSLSLSLSLSQRLEESLLDMLFTVSVLLIKVRCCWLGESTLDVSSVKV